MVCRNSQDVTSLNTLLPKTKHLTKSNYIQFQRLQNCALNIPGRWVTSFQQAMMACEGLFGYFGLIYGVFFTRSIPRHRL